MQNDLIESLKNDIPQYTGVNPRVVTKERIESLLATMGVDNILSFGAFFTYDSACFAKFARIYRDVYVFNVPESDAFKLNA